MTVVPSYVSLIVLGIIALTAVVGIGAARRISGHTLSGFFFVEGRVHWILVTMSLFGSVVWAMVALVAATPVVMSATELWLPLVALAAGVAVFVPPAVPGGDPGSGSLASLLMDRYSPGVGQLVAVAWIGFAVLIRIPLTILVGSRILYATLGWDHLQASLLLVVLPGLLIVTRGYAGVLIGSAGSFLVMALAMVALLAGGIPPSVRMALGDVTQEALPLPALLAGSIMFGCWYGGADQVVFHQARVARGRRTLRIASLGVVIGAIILGAAAGMTGPAPSPSAGSGWDVAAQILIAAAALLFALTALSAHYVAVAALAGLDMYRRARPKKDEGSVLLVGRTVTTVVVILAILAGAILGLVGIERVDWFVRAFAVFAPPLTAVTLLGRFWPRMHGRGAMWALASGWGCGFAWSVILADTIASVFIGMMVVFGLSAVVLVAASFAVAPASDRAGTRRVFDESGLRSHRP